MSKILVTHINPHLDDIAAIWLFKKFNPEFKDARLEFLKATSGTITFENKPVDENPDVVHFGIGKGKFDEHKGDIDECATSLVWKTLRPASQGEQAQGINIDSIEKLALQRIVEWVTLEDTGRLSVGEYDEFSVPAFIRPDDSTQEGSKKSVELGSEILDRILKVVKNTEQAKVDWEKRVEFESKFGKSIAVNSTAIDRNFCKSKGGDLFLMYDPRSGHVQYFTPSHEIDLEPIYTKVKELDLQADWFLHHSHHMVICGSGTAPDSKKTKLSFEQLMEAVKNI